MIQQLDYIILKCLLQTQKLSFLRKYKQIKVKN